MEDVSQRLQLGDQFLVVVDLPVEDDNNRAILVEKRLLSCGYVDDRQPAVPQRDAGFEVQPLPIGSAVGLGVVHLLKDPAVEFAPTAGIEESCYAAHVSSS